MGFDCDERAMHALGDRVLILPDEAESISPGGIVLPDAAQEVPCRGVVVSKGPDVGGVLHEGDKVLFAKYTGSMIEVGERRYQIVKLEDVLLRLDAVLEEEAAA